MIKITEIGEISVTAAYVSSDSAYPYWGEVQVSFDKKYSNPPIVFTNIKNNSAFWNSSARNISNNGFSITIGGNNSSPQTVSYMVIKK